MTTGAHRHSRSLTELMGGSWRIAAGCTFPAIADALRARVLVSPANCFTPEKWAGDRSLFKASEKSPDVSTRLANEKVEAEKRAAQAHRLWCEARPIAGTLAEQYLRARAIRCNLPETLRFHPACWHSATAQHLPAMLALVEGAEHFAIHRTYLRSDGRKGNVEPAKAMLGPCAGGAVRLSDCGGPLVVAEGIETALSLLSGLLQGPATTWAALSTSGMKAMNLPPKAGKLTIAPDGDASGKEAAHCLATRATALGWQVSLLPAPDGRDWNDVLRGGVAA